MASITAGLSEEAIAAIAAGIESLLAGAGFITGWFPNSWVNAATLRVLNGTPPAGKLYQRGLDGGGDLTISSNNQGEWSNLVDMVAADSGWQGALNGIKSRICDDIRQAGWRDGEITRDQIRDQGISVAAPQLNSSDALGRSLNWVYTPYRWRRVESESGCTFEVTVRVEDYWNFDKAHVWKEMQEEGVLTPYDVTVDMGDHGIFRIECPDCE